MFPLKETLVRLSSDSGTISQLRISDTDTRKADKSLVLLKATAVVIFLVILGMVDLHTDGVLVRDGCYVIRPDEMKTYRMDVYGNSGIVGTWVNLVRDVDGASQIFAIHYTGEDQYMIEYS